jgi:hypothetical protein
MTEGGAAKTGWWEKIKSLFTRAKESEFADKAGDIAEKAWDKTKDTAEAAWDKTKDVAGDVKEKVEEKIEERRESEGDDEVEKTEG